MAAAIASRRRSPAPERAVFDPRTQRDDAAGRPIGGISSDRWSAYMHDQLGLGHLTCPRTANARARRSDSLPFPTYSAPGGLRQDPGRAAESAAAPRIWGEGGKK